MIIGRLVTNTDGEVEEVAETTVYETWDATYAAAQALRAENADNESVVGIFIATERSPTEYRVRTIL